MRCLAILAVSVLSLVQARVTFQYSEVFQAHDLAGTNKVNFKCEHQCDVYVDFRSKKLVITQNGDIVTDFDSIIGKNDFAPTGSLLMPGVEYTLENRGEVDPHFVMYVVDMKAPNYGAKVYVPQTTVGIAMKDAARYVTILSSFDALWFSGFSGVFPEDYPRIYTTGYDSVGTRCQPVYQARSQYNAENSWPTIASAVFTVDFGFVGEHNASVNYGNVNDRTTAAGTSTVYTSPGFVGCAFNAGQNYYSKLNQVQDKFTLQAEYLDIHELYNGLTAGEPVHFSVNDRKVNIVGSVTDSDHLANGTLFDVELSWTRSTPGSSFAIQLDFGTAGDQPALPITTPTLPPSRATTIGSGPVSNPAPLPTSLSPYTAGTIHDYGVASTTKIGRSLSTLPALALVIAACVL